MLDHGASFPPQKAGCRCTVLTDFARKLLSHMHEAHTSTQIGGKSQQYFYFIEWMEKDFPICE